MSTTTLSAETMQALKAAKRIFQHNRTMTLVSHAEGRVWANKVYFAEEGGYLYGVIEKPTPGRGHHYQNILQNPKVFFIIDRGVPDLFLQGEGEIEILGPVAERPERHLLFRKVPQAVVFAKYFPLLVFRIRPTRLLISDYRVEWKPRAQVEVTDTVLQAFQGPLRTATPTWKVYWQAVRPFAFTVTFFAALLGGLLAPTLSWPLLVATLVGALLVHAGVNVLSDYMDYRRGVDTWATLGSSRVLPDRMLSPRQHLVFGVVLLLVAAGIGGALTVLRGLPVLYIALAGAFLGVFYTVPPIGLKYRALGDLAVFLAFNPLMALGAYYVQAQGFAWEPVILSLPLGFLTTAILHGNNFRDIQDDQRAGFTTVAGYLGFKGSGYYYLALVVATYGAVAVAIGVGLLPWWGVLTFLTLPLAWRNVRAAFQPRRVAFTFLDLVTAQLHLYFGLALVTSVVLGRWVG
ncbi:MAG: UbiA family prenyltransferase [Dehalococcoidia bacterium]|nr:UbiA family prenyltransferase [Dehalococcoidia bacterium]MDW8119768.1 UbiA family prenyltransferase [Chloroflexota bacterium]